MGGRKDMCSKRQLSIIDETDYFSDDGPLQRHDSYRFCYEGSDVSEVVMENQLNFSHDSQSKQCIKDKTHTSLTERNVLSNKLSYCKRDSTSVHNSADSSQAYVHSVGTLIPVSCVMTDGCTLSHNNNNYPKQNTEDMVMESYCSRKTIEENVHSNDEMDNRSINRTGGSNYASSSSNDFKTGDVCESCLNHQLCKNASKFNDSETGIQIRHEFNKAPDNAAESNADNIHELFQILIKSIDGTHVDKRIRYSGGDTEDTCRSSPLLYLMEEKVEKQPQGVDNIISSFKEKFSLPNSKRFIERQKSRRNLAQEITEANENEETNTSNFISRENRSRNEVSREERFGNNLTGHLKLENKLQTNADCESICEIIKDEFETHQQLRQDVDFNSKESGNKKPDITIETEDNSKKNSESDVFKDNEVQKPNSIQNSDGGSEEAIHSFYGNETPVTQIECNYNRNKLGFKVATNNFYLNRETRVEQGSKSNETCDICTTSTVVNTICENDNNINSTVPCLSAPVLQISPDMDTYNLDVNIVEENLNCVLESNKDKGTLPVNSQNASADQDETESVACVEKLPIPTFKRDGPKAYEDNEIEDSLNGSSQMHTSQKKFMSSAKGKTHFLTVPNSLQVPSQNVMPLSAHDQEQAIFSSKSSPSSSATLCPLSHGQLSKAVTFLNSNGSIVKRPMLRHVSQPNMNAHRNPSFPNPSGPANSGQLRDASGSSPAESKFQTKDLNSDLAKLKSTAVRLNLVTRRPSYLEWLEDRRKNRPLLVLGILDPKQVNDSDNSMNCNDSFLDGYETTGLKHITGQNQTCDLINSMSRRRDFTGRKDSGSSSEDYCDSNGSSRRSSSSSSCSEGNSDILNTCSDSEATNADDTADEISDNGVHSFQNTNQRSETKGHVVNKMDSLVRMTRSGNHRNPRDRLTAARKERINKSLEWLRTELKTMRSQDQALARQLLSLRHEMHKLRLSWSCQEHRDLLDEVQCELEDFQEFSKVLDLPSTVYLDTPLKNVGVTRLNISARRFSTC